MHSTTRSAASADSGRQAFDVGRHRSSLEWMHIDSSLVTNPVPYTRERGLWLAVLWRALADYCGQDAFEQESARRWLHDNRIYEGSYLWICDTLGIEPDKLRTAITDNFAYFCQRFRAINNTGQKR